MQDVLKFLEAGKFHQALVELYGLGCAHGTSGSRNFDSWSPASACQAALEKRLVHAVSADDCPVISLHDAERAPLVLLREIERRLCQGKRFVASTSSECLFTDSRGDARWLVRRQNAHWSKYPAAQSPSARYFLSSHSCFPQSFSVGDSKIFVVRHVLAAAPKPRAQLKMRVSHFVDSASVDWIETSDTFVVTGLKDEAQRKNSVLAELQIVRELGCDVWVAPEYAVTQAIVDEVARDLADNPISALQIAVPGSYAHRSGGLMQRNRATALSGGGAALCHSDKLTELTIELPPGPRRLREHIEHPQRVDIIETPIGLVAVLICKDFCDDAGGIVRAVWDAIAPDWMLIPSMGDENSLAAHRLAAEHFVKLHGASVVLANQETGLANPAAVKPGFVRVQVIATGRRPASQHIEVDGGGSTLTVSSPLGP